MFLILLKASWNQTKDLKVKNRKRVLISFIHPDFFYHFVLYYDGLGEQASKCFTFSTDWMGFGEKGFEARASKEKKL